MNVFKDFMCIDDMKIDDLIKQLSEIREKHGNLDVLISVEIEVNGESVYTFGIPREVRFNEKDKTAEIELKNYFEV